MSEDPFEERLDEDLADTARMAAAFEAELTRLRSAMTMTTREAGTLGSGIERGVGRAVDDLALHGDSLGDVLRGLAETIADTAYGIAMKPVEGAISGTIGNLFGAMGVPAVSAFAKGGAFASGRVGDVVGGPTGFSMRGGAGLMGEAGPEAIMPLQRGPDGRLGVASSGGGATNVTFNIQTPDVAGFQRSQSQIAAQMSRVLARGDRIG